MLKKLLTLTICLLFLSSIVSGAWLTGYGYRKKITIQGAFLDANVTHFPLLVYTVDGDIDDHCDDDGDRSHDIMFTQSDGTTELDIDWEEYSEAGGNATVIAWVSNAGWEIESDGSTEIYLYYSNAAAGDPATDEGVWDSSFQMVHHMTGAVFTDIDDSTSNNHDVANEYGAKTYQQTGQIHEAVHFDGTSGYLRGSTTVAVSTVITASAWLYPDDSPVSYEQWLNLGFAADPGRYYFATEDNDLLMFYAIDAGGDTGWQMSNAVTVTPGQWNYVAIAYTASGGVIDYYANGVKDGGDNGVYERAGAIDYRFYIAASYSPSRYFDGLIDEIRVSSVARADAWLKFEYHNAFQADNELTWAGEEEAPSNGFIPKVIIIR